MYVLLLNAPRTPARNDHGLATGRLTYADAARSGERGWSTTAAREGVE
jgi:hypothetical protein